MCLPNKSADSVTRQKFIREVRSSKLGGKGDSAG